MYITFIPLLSTIIKHTCKNKNMKVMKKQKQEISRIQKMFTITALVLKCIDFTELRN